MFTQANTLNDVVAEAAAAFPGKAALSDGAQNLTYGELHARTEAAAWRLARMGVAKGDLVGLMVERSVDTVVGILAILRCGAAYVPIDPTYPLERREFVIRDSGIGIITGSQEVLTTTRTARSLRTCALDALGGDDGLHTPPAGVQPSDPAYVIYTSGSTGIPKGCLITHGNVLSLLRHALPLFTLDSDDCWSVFHSFSFDFSVWELWGALATGARAVIVPHTATRLPSELTRLLVQEKVTVLSHVPSVFRYFSRLERYPGDQLRYIVFGGESVDLPSIAAFWSQCAEARPEVVNMYGITETTVHATFRRITEPDLTSGNVSPIGTPLAHLTIELRDEQPPHAPVADGETGEMWIAGAGVADGYLNRPELTSQRFVTDDQVDAARRYYRSGDLARRLPNGELEYMGRNDHQVKLRGFRIELGEVEAAIRRQPHATDAALCVAAGRAGAELLVACVVPSCPEVEPSATVASIRDDLAEKLPEHMLPDRYLLLPTLPLTLSGKLDRRELDRIATRAVRDAATLRPIF
ncbi:amino acid adenylation domain-containing protein [Streptomyces sp. NPDC088755]|uniref:amino acid adenylation domain-containing protein n=1 Tax=Streptomyces sp. NPDC088755 TaxID=3365888 RepID=UPI0037FD04CE